MSIPTPCPDTTRAFLDRLILPGTATEFRIIAGCRPDKQGRYRRTQEYPRRWVGWFDNATSLTLVSKRLVDVSGYVIANPVTPAFLAKGRGKNLMEQAVKDGATKDENIVGLSQLLIDIDVKLPASDISATDEELKRALDRRDQLLALHPELVPHLMFGCSGNGAWGTLNLPGLANNEENRFLVAKINEYFHRRLSDALVEVDR
jgi:hypothetical protein